jgi:hypothetical protein
VALEHNPEDIVEDGFDVGDAVGIALAFIEQVKSFFLSSSSHPQITTSSSVFQEIMQGRRCW